MNTAYTKEVLQKDSEIFYSPPSEPISVLQRWLTESRERNVQQPGAMALATADALGRASNRIVQLLELRKDSLIFVSHANSQKGKEIAITGWACALFYWKETNEQVMLSGSVTRLTDAECDLIWAKRPQDTYPMSVASHQSEILDDENELRERVAQLALSSEALSRPSSWVAYALKPMVVEFWQGSKDRLHRRLRYDATEDGWSTCRLQP